jgi:hypothetical protein
MLGFGSAANDPTPKILRNLQKRMEKDHEGGEDPGKFVGSEKKKKTPL